MTIINKTTHVVEWRADAGENWMGEGWAVVPEELRDAALSSGGACEITLDESGETVVALTATERPASPPPEPTQAEIDRADLEYVAAMAGVSLTEGGGAPGASSGGSGGDDVMDPMGTPDVESGAFSAAKLFYPRLWPLWRLDALKAAGKLTPAEYDEVKRGAGT